MLLESGHILVASVLLKNGANVNARANKDETPLSLAKKYGQLLKANGARKYDV